MGMAENIKELRKANGYTMEELANMLGVGKSAVNKWEKGYVTNIKRPTIMKMAKIFNVSPAYLMDIETFDTPLDYEKKWVELGGSHSLTLTHTEQLIILNYRAADIGTQNSILKLLDIEEPTYESQKD